jgi:predicted metal-dependent RNase
MAAPGALKRRSSMGDQDSVFVTPLGAGQEVGRSCIIIKHKVSHRELSPIRAMRLIRRSGQPRDKDNVLKERLTAVPSWQGRNIMLDCGIHPGLLGEECLPYFDVDNSPAADEVDLILISHFHLDHAAALPYFTERCNGGAFKGRIFATHPTKVQAGLWSVHVCDRF